MGKLKFLQLPFFIRAACCVPRACVNGTMGIHSFNFSCVLRAAWKYELAFTRALYIEPHAEVRCAGGSLTRAHYRLILGALYVQVFHGLNC